MFREIQETACSYADRAAARIERQWRLFLCLIAEIYLIRTLVHTMRPMWYDEIFTLYMSRLPDMGAIWSASKDGADLNPPLFYVVTRAFQAVFGGGEWATRLPAVVGFLIMLLCLFRFVSRYSRLGAFAAMTFPLITGAYYYATEARAYGMVLGFAGMAAVFWQAAARGERRKLSLAGLAISLACALLTHCYAVLLLVPFALAEAARLFASRKPDYPMLAALAAPCPSVLVYFPLFAAVRGDTFQNPIYQPSWEAIPACYDRFFGPALWPLAAVLCIFLLASTLRKSVGPGELSGSGMPLSELALAAGLALTPVFGVLLGKSFTGVFMDRYGLASLIGFSILVGALTSFRNGRSRAAAASAAIVFMACFVLVPAISVAGEMLRPADSQRAPRKALKLSTLDPAVPIVMANGLLFLEYEHYEPAGVAGRMYYLTDAAAARRYTGTSNFDRASYTLRKWFPIRAHVEDYSRFLAAHPRFFILTDYGFPMDWAMRRMLDDGIPLRFLGEFPSHHGRAILAEVSR